MTLNNLRVFYPISILFILVGIIVLAFKTMLAGWNVDGNVLVLGNLFLFLVTYISFSIAERGLQNKNPHAFMRSIMGSIIFKMFLSIIAAFIYISIHKKELNKAAFFICMGLYLVYTFLEVSILTRLLRKQPNA